MDDGAARRKFGVRNKQFNHLKRENDISDIIRFNHNKDGADRRGFLKCMAWAGTGVL